MMVVMIIIHMMLILIMTLMMIIMTWTIIMIFYVKKRGIVFDEFYFCVSVHMQDEYMTIATVNTYDTSCALSNDPILFIIISISILNSFLIFFLFRSYY